MKLVARPFILLGLAAAMATVVGCTNQRPVAKRPIQPDRSVEELYAMAAKYNERAEPVLLGTGDGIGQRTYDIYVEEEVMNGK
jgi:hypothetical protein